MQFAAAAVNRGPTKRGRTLSVTVLRNGSNNVSMFLFYSKASAASSVEIQPRLKDGYIVNCNTNQLSPISKP
eukprot:COSAG02_NODE_2084_length_9892_cov_47.719085_7_plen_72_part_00